MKIRIHRIFLILCLFYLNCVTADDRIHANLNLLDFASYAEIENTLLSKRATFSEAEWKAVKPLLKNCLQKAPPSSAIDGPRIPVWIIHIGSLQESGKLVIFAEIPIFRMFNQPSEWEEFERSIPNSLSEEFGKWKSEIVK